jgi:hypothetical protein
VLEHAMGDDRVDGPVGQHREAGPLKLVDLKRPLADEVHTHPFAHIWRAVDRHELLAMADQVSGQPSAARAELDARERHTVRPGVLRLRGIRLAEAVHGAVSVVHCRSSPSVGACR